MNVKTLKTGKVKHVWITLSPAGWDLKLRRLLKEHGAQIVKLDVFGRTAGLNGLKKWVRKNCGYECPTGGVSGGKFSGVQVYAAAGVKVKTVYAGGLPAGRFYDDRGYRYCAAACVLPGSTGFSRKRQAEDVMQKLETVVKEAGMGISSVVRTWFYNRDILGWYGGFNETRDEFFRKKKLFKGVIPASTCIGTPGARGPAGGCRSHCRKA